MRIAKSLGLHTDMNAREGSGPHHAELRRRLWYSLRDLDTDLACSLGRSPECHEPAHNVSATPMTVSGHSSRLMLTRPRAEDIMDA